MKFVIVGGSIAAHTAYKTLKSIDSSFDITVVSKEKFKPYPKMLLPYLINSDELKDSMFYDIEDKDIILNNEATAIDTAKKIIKTNRGLDVSYDKLLIATGAEATMPQYNGNYSNDSVVVMRNIEDVEKVKRKTASCNNKNAVMVGAGLVTLEVGWALVKAGYSVTYVVRSNRILSQILDKESSEMVEKYIEQNFPVKFIKESDIEIIKEKNNGVYVRLTTKKEMNGCVVVVGKGVKPSVDFLKGSSIKILNGGIDVNGYLQTGSKDIYAVGDAAVFEDVADNSKRVHPIWPVAVEQAKSAAKNMAGIKTYHMPEFSRNALPVFGITIFSGGISNKNQFDVYKVTLTNEYRKIILKNGVLKGFVLIGDVGNYGAYTYTAKRKIKIGDKINKLLYGSLNINRL